MMQETTKLFYKEINMCGMFFTTDFSILSMLSEANKKRGGINESVVDVLGGVIYHYQAPTSNLSKFHPNRLENDLLWHNGLLKEHQIAELQEIYNTDEGWDTALLHTYIKEGKDLSVIDGSFAVFRFVNGELYACRNALVTLYSNEDHSVLSSAKIKGVCDKLIDHGYWYKYTDGKFVKQDGHFETKNNPYNI